MCRIFACRQSDCSHHTRNVLFAGRRICSARDHRGLQPMGSALLSRDGLDIFPFCPSWPLSRIPARDSLFCCPIRLKQHSYGIGLHKYTSQPFRTGQVQQLYCGTWDHDIWELKCSDFVRWIDSGVGTERRWSQRTEVQYE